MHEVISWITSVTLGKWNSNWNFIEMPSCRISCSYHVSTDTYTPKICFVSEDPQTQIIAIPKHILPSGSKKRYAYDSKTPD